MNFLQMKPFFALRARTATLSRLFSSNAAALNRGEEKGDTEHQQNNLIQFLTINNTQKRNALSRKVLLDLKEQLCSLKEQKVNPPKVVILRSEGPVFCSGHDLKELKSCDSSSHVEIFHLCSQVMQLLHQLPQPVIARVQGTHKLFFACNQRR